MTKPSTSTIGGSSARWERMPGRPENHVPCSSTPSSSTGKCQCLAPPHLVYSTATLPMNGTLTAREECSLATVRGLPVGSAFQEEQTLKGRSVCKWTPWGTRWSSCSFASRLRGRRLAG